MTCGIYMIQNLVNGKIYIGQSVDIEDRWKGHKECLRGNRNKPNKHLQSAWNKYGESNFEFTIICECEESQLNTKEIEYISKLRTYNSDFGYNKTYGGEGCRPTEETRRKQSEAKKGKTFSEETKEKMSEAHKGRTFSEEHKENLSESHKGKTLSEETKKNISEALKGKNNPMYGKHHSEDTKSKLSIPILQIDPSTNKVINVWKSSKDAERIGDYKQTNIIKCCKNKFNREGNNIYKGYKWQYLHIYMHNIDPRIKKVILFGKEYVF